MQKNTDHIFGLKQQISGKILKLHNCANPCTHILFLLQLGQRRNEFLLSGAAGIISFRKCIRMRIV